MEKSKYLVPFRYDPSTKDKITTWNGKKATVIYELKSGNLLVLINDDDSEKIIKYNINGEIIDESYPEDSDYSKLYIDTSILRWVNVSGDSTYIKYSPLYNSREEALENLKDDEFDTIMIRMFK